MAFAQLTHTPNRHVVVLVDVDPAQCYLYMLNDESQLPNKLANYLQDNGLYKDGDYLTIATYSFNLAETGGKNFDTFVTIPKDASGKAIKWIQPAAANPLKGFVHNWNSITRVQHATSQPTSPGRGSLNSMKLYYALDAVDAHNEKIGANELIILTVSEDLHQGNDNIAGDLRTLYEAPECKITPASKQIIEQQANARSAEAKKKFTFITEHNSAILDGSWRLPYQISKTEVKTAHDPSIQNILHLPALPELERARGGYRLKIDSPQTDPEYTLEKLELTLHTKNGTKTYTSGRGEDLDIVIPRGEVVDQAPEASLRAWIRYNDCLYNSLILSPYDESNKGLTMSQGLRTDSEPKIFGFLGVNDFFWFPFLPESYYTTVMIYTVLITAIIVILLTIFVMWATRKLASYSPPSKGITIAPVKLPAMAPASVPVSPSSSGNPAPRSAKNKGAMKAKK